MCNPGTKGAIPRMASLWERSRSEVVHLGWIGVHPTSNRYLKFTVRARPATVSSASRSSPDSPESHGASSDSHPEQLPFLSVVLGPRKYIVPFAFERRKCQVELVPTCAGSTCRCEENVSLTEVVVAEASEYRKSATAEQSTNTAPL